MSAATLLVSRGFFARGECHDFSGNLCYLVQVSAGDSSALGVFGRCIQEFDEAVRLVPRGQQ
jgi:hypothetical protein